ncbi:MAG: transcriptional repressor [Acidobacteria bacterium]|nr:transcriptional repressor [Acidobacteriota bacterium]
MENRRITRQRQVILEELRMTTSHPTADELYLNVRKRLPNISLGTIYRNLDLMSSAGVILKLEAAGSAKRFDGNIQPHHHIRCVACGHISDIPIDRIPSIPMEPTLMGFSVTGYHLDVEGVCPSCRETGVNVPAEAGERHLPA